MPPQSWSRLALSTIENSGSWGSILGRRICSCSSSLQRLIIIATPVFCQRPWIQGTGFRLKACLLHLFLPSLYLSLSLSLYIFLYIYIYIHMCVHNRFESSSSKKKLVFYVKVCLCLNCIRLVCLSRFVYTCIYVQTLSSPHVRLSWCYKWEDFMGVCRALAASCKQSGHGVAFCKRLLEKYTYLL